MLFNYKTKIYCQEYKNKKQESFNKTILYIKFICKKKDYVINKKLMKKTVKWLKE